MDQAFFLRAKRMLEQRQAAPLDHEMLLAALRTQRSSCPTATIAARCTAPAPPPGESPQSIAALILAEEEWRIAVEMQAGCFSRAVAARRVNTPSTQLTGIFT